MVTEWRHLFYFIACPRSDGTAPDLNKAVDNMVFMTLEDAQVHRGQLYVADPEGPPACFKIFIAEAVIPPAMPVTSDNPLGPYTGQGEVR